MEECVGVKVAAGYLSVSAGDSPVGLCLQDVNKATFHFPALLNADSFTLSLLGCHRLCLSAPRGQQ